MVSGEKLNNLRHKSVNKDNLLIQNSKITCTMLEYKAVTYVISKVLPTDEPEKLYIFNCSEFQALLNWNKDSSYNRVKNMLQKISDTSIWIDMNQYPRKETLIRWFNIVRMEPGSGNIEIGFHPDMHNILTRKKGYFTDYMLQEISLMKSNYSIRLYELLKSYSLNNQKWTFENGTRSEYDLQLKIAESIKDPKTGKLIPKIPAGWSNWAIFKRDVIEPAVEEINKYTAIKVAYEGKKQDLHKNKTRGYSTIEFYIVSKTNNEQKATDELIDKEYAANNYVSPLYHQQTLEEVFFKKHEEALQKEAAEKKIFAKAQEVVSDEIKLLYDELNGAQRNADFSVKQVKALFDRASQKIAGRVLKESKELFIVDYVCDYYDYVVETSEKTKTDTYTRLMDLVKKDYDGRIDDYLNKQSRE